MSHFTKLLCCNVTPHLCSFYRQGSIKKAGGKWAELLDVREKDYFTKKDQEFINYIKAHLKQGKPIKKIMEDYKKTFMDKVDAAKKRVTAHASSSKKSDQDNYFLTKNKMFMEYVQAEIKKGRKMDDIVNEAKKILEEKRQKWKSKS